MKAAPPFHTWVTQLKDERFGFAWYTAPCAFVDQVVKPHATVELVHALHDAIDVVLERYAEDVRTHRGLLIVHDWRQMKGYDSDARRVFLERMKARKPGYLRHVVAVLPDRPLLKMAAQTASIVMGFSSGGTLRIAQDPVPVLEEQQVQRPVGSGWYGSAPRPR